MNKLRCVVLVLCVLLVVGAPALAIVLTWTGADDGTSWDEANWDYTGICGITPCYPSTAGDEAIIGDDCDSCTINLVDEEIDELYVEGGGDMAFDDGDASNPELLVSYFLARDEDDALTIRIKNGAIIKHASAP